MVQMATDFIAAGGNMHPTAADWDPHGSGLLAFGAGNNIALWKPLDPDYRGCYAALSGHTKTVNVVRFLSVSNPKETVILSGSADNTIRVWASDASSPTGFVQKDVLTAHTASINCIAVLPGSDVIVSGAADATLRSWKVGRGEDGTSLSAQLLQTIDLKQKPRETFFPLTASLALLNNSTLVLAVAGTKNSIQIYVHDETAGFALAATLKGHEDWIRSLAFARENPNDGSSDLLLASASQDKYIRLWRIHEGSDLPEVSKAADNPALGALGKSLHNKAHRFEARGAPHSVTFEALLVGHEDWIYSALWRHQPVDAPDASRPTSLQLLSASADNSVAIWEADPVSGVWLSVTRLGEISAQKGATTATGSAGGFWIGLWSPDGDAVVSLGRTGSWRLWSYAADEDRWTQRVAVSGHVRAVKGVAWAPDGSYLLTTSADQTTRQFAQWQRRREGEGQGERRQLSWHEFSRPQIHGYDLNCVDAITPLRFISGADEKLLRVFEQPAAVADLLEQLCGATYLASAAQKAALPDAANIPVLGLSNKAIDAVADAPDNQNRPPSAPTNGEAVPGEGPETGGIDPAVVRGSILQLSHPPLEDHLARHLLWPETEKLYGHGYEVNTVASSHSGHVVATACRATSVDHAVIRLYETTQWRQVCLVADADGTQTPSMRLHSLTVTGLAFSPDDLFLLSVGRDRLFGLWRRRAGAGEAGSEGAAAGAQTYALALSQEKAHSRMLLGASWAPLVPNASAARVFATAGRDSRVKLWRIDRGGGDDDDDAAAAACTCAAIATLVADAPVTAVAFCPAVLADGRVALAYGTEKGGVSVGVFAAEFGDAVAGADQKMEPLALAAAPSDAVNQLAWRPRGGRREQTSGGKTLLELAVASEDGSTRIYGIEV